MCDLTMRSVLVAAVILASTCWAAEPSYVIGSTNPDMYEGARALLAGRNEEGIRLTLKGLQAANGKKEEENALSNLCAGYMRLDTQFVRENLRQIPIEPGERLLLRVKPTF